MQRKIDDIDLIVLTHLHADYTRGVEKLRSLCHAPVAAAASKRQVMAGEKTLPKFGHFAGQVLSGALGHRDFLSPVATQQMKLVDIWLNDVEGLPEHLDWRVIVNAGHTSESLCLYQPFSEELLCGDTLIALEGGTLLWREGMSRQQREETWQLLRSLKVRYLYPRHGRPLLSPQPLTESPPTY
jgi:hydroxyacylglutathione hydrolase